MGSKFSLRCAAVIAMTALVGGCGPDTSQRQGERQGSSRDGSAQSRPGDSSVSRNESGQPRAGANRDSTVRPPTTATNPAAPGSAAAPPSAQGRLAARAEIKPLGDHTVRGLVEFQQAPQGSSGPLMIHVMLMGLDAGPHGMHVHMGTDCMSPGTHLNPLNAPHGPANAASGMRHLGDLGNITADASGIADEMLHDSLLGSDATFLGKVLVVHEGQDDLSTQPDGSSGTPVACGVIEAAGEDILSRGPAPDRGV
jgi:superoxide dismutase, Cu-Zn family